MKWVKTPEQYWIPFLLLIIMVISSCAVGIRLDDDPCNITYKEYSISCAVQNVRVYEEGWLTIIGDGNDITITDYWGDDPINGMEVYEGDVCTDLTFIGGTPESTFTFSSVDGQRYFIKLMAFGLAEMGGIKICSADELAVNDDCGDYIVWEPETLLLGSTANATASSPPVCLQDNGKGVWYQMIGDGQTYNLNLLNANLQAVLFFIAFGSDEIHYNIYEGNCSNLVCVLGKDGNGPTTFTTEVGKTYYIYVTSRLPQASYTFLLTKSTCTDLITGLKIESCPGSSYSRVTIETSQNNLTFLPVVHTEDEGIVYSTAFGTADGIITSTTGVFDIPSGTEGYFIAFEGNDPFGTDCWDYAYYSVTGNEPDLTPPKARCKDHTLELDQQGMATLEVSMVNKNSSDNCGIVMRTLSETNFDCDDLGDHTITLTVEDAAGLTASCTSTVTVVDNSPPTPQCNNLTVTLDEDGIKNLLVDQIDNGSSDNCSVQTLQLNPAIVDCDDAMIGGGTVQLTVTDNSGNTNSCTAVITVTDVTPPMANCMDATVSLDNNGEGTLNPSDVDDNSSDACGIQSLSLDNTTFTCADIGPNNSVTLTVTDNNGNTSNCDATVTVIDNLPPTAVCKNTTVEIQPNGLYVLTEADVYDAINSSDNCAIDAVSFPATTFSCDDLDLTIPITLTLTDASANMANCNALITVVLGDALPNEWNTSDIGQVTIGNAYSFDPCANDNPVTGEFTITGSGNNAIGTTSDNIAFAHQSLCGDGSITAKIESVTPNGYGGLSIRETNAPNSKQVSIFSNLTNVLRHETRYLINANKVVQAFFKPSPFWLKLERQGDWFFAYYSSTGSNFQYVHGVYVPMQQCVEIGMASFTYQPYAQTEAVFSNVTIGTGNSVFNINEDALEIKPYEVIPNLELSVFPNPADHSFSIVFERPVESSKILQLYNSFGQLVGIQHLESGANRIDWEIEHLPEGVYLISDDKKSFVEQLIISK